MFYYHNYYHFFFLVFYNIMHVLLQCISLHKFTPIYGVQPCEINPRMHEVVNDLQWWSGDQLYMQIEMM